MLLNKQTDMGSYHFMTSAAQHAEPAPVSDTKCFRGNRIAVWHAVHVKVVIMTLMLFSSLVG
jgi:hypothetical protein